MNKYTNELIISYFISNEEECKTVLSKINKIKGFPENLTYSWTNIRKNSLNSSCYIGLDKQSKDLLLLLGYSENKIVNKLPNYFTNANNNSIF